jgi:hypothetical protein
VFAPGKVGRWRESATSIDQFMIRWWNMAVPSRRQVQRLLTGRVEGGKIRWRANLLRYDRGGLHQPRLENDPPSGNRMRRICAANGKRFSRLPQPDAVAFVIHTTVVAVETPKDAIKGLR